MKHFNKHITDQLDTLKTGCKQLGLPQDEIKLEKFGEYLSLLMEWNRKINIFSKLDTKRLASRHIMESIAPLAMITIRTGESLFDIGTGAGFPGIPLKIIRPDLHLTMVESRRKKNLFLNKVTGLLQLENTRILHERAENLYTTETGTTNYVFIREVGNMELLLKIAFPFLNPGGYLVTFKSPEEARSINNVNIRKFNSKASIHLNASLPDWDGQTRQTCLIVLKKH